MNVLAPDTPELAYITDLRDTNNHRSQDQRHDEHFQQPDEYDADRSEQGQDELFHPAADRPQRQERLIDQQTYDDAGSHTDENLPVQFHADTILIPAQGLILPKGSSKDAL